MPAEAFPRIDVTTWQVIADETSGVEEKMWLQDPTQDKTWLYKSVTSSAGYVCGEDWAEKVTAHLGERLGIPCARVELAENDGRHGSISENLRPHTYELQHGGLLMMARNVPRYVPGKVRGRPGYSLENIRIALDGVQPPPGNVPAGASAPSNPATAATRRLIVTWQHPDSRWIEPVGFLSYDGELYSFDYIRHALQVADFQPLLGFGDVHHSYKSEILFPLFAQRVMDPRRPDYHRYVERLGLTEDASPWEQIARSQGRRQGDSLQLLPEPVISDENLTCLFLVNGMRHVPSRPVTLGGRQLRVTSEQVESALSELRPGDPLRLISEPSNKFNPLAIMVTGSSSTPLGWVPNLLVEDLNRLLALTAVQVTAVHINGPDAPWHLRLLAQLSATHIGNFRFFTDNRWEVLTKENSQ